MKKLSFFYLLLFCISSNSMVNAQIPPDAPPVYLVNEVVDISGDFRDFSNTYYLADSLGSFDPATGQGTVVYRRYEYFTRQAFNNILAGLKPVQANEFPGREYAASPVLPFSIEFISPRTIRIRTHTGLQAVPEEESLMLVNGRVSATTMWPYTKIPGGHRYKGAYGSVLIRENPWRIEFYNASGELITRTVHRVDNDSTYTPLLPFSYVRRASDYSRSIAAVFSLGPLEKIFGCGESFTGLNKRGQKVVLFADDANGVENETMYKPIPFFLSSNGYGMFMHTSTPITCDFGKYYSGAASLMIGDDKLDLFVFLGKPAEILDEYTTLTGKSPMPPLWSFGFWQSRITYFSETEGRAIASNLRKHRIPSDVIHFDTGWFEEDWRCDYRFSPSRFDDPAGMIADLKKQGFHTCLWQLPYFVPKNRLFPELIEKDLVVRDRSGNLPYEDAVLDFSNPETVEWYQEKIGDLLKMGVGAIKVDFGEAAPLNGIYHSGRSGFYEHNLYPLRYNKAAADITRTVNDENVIWARSAWAGSQRYPLHWGGDAAATDVGMAAELRGGLSFGLSGFTFWSHDMGGFTATTPENLYRRWAAFGAFSSHARSHGTPPKEAWEYSKEFLDYFRLTMETRYRLIPYIYAQAKDCSLKGLPIVRALFLDYPDDPGSWLIEDQYLFGSDMLVAPLFSNTPGRPVYLPDTHWIDYQTGRRYAPGWHYIEKGEIDIILLVKEGALIPHIKLAQSTMHMDWSALDLVVYTVDEQPAKGLICLPENNVLHEITLQKTGKNYRLAKDPFDGKVSWSIKHFEKL
ncbi:MAG: alpha-xylosidase [Bacteroidales bacterium]|nr:alpha-xylosidase [Bacteroidales bacterium]MBN2699066.1 alpha-xylosidase [Bacteroidales bacterium]